MRHLRTLQPSVLKSHAAGLQLIFVARDLSGSLVGSDLLILPVIDRHPLEIIDVINHKIAFCSDNGALSIRRPEHRCGQCSHPSVLVNQCQIVLLIQMLARICAGSLHA